MSKFKKLKDENGLQQQQQVSSENRTKVSSSIPEKFCKIFKKTKKKHLTKDKCKKLKEKYDGLSWDDEKSLPTTPESFNGEYDENQNPNNHMRNSSLKMRNRMNRRKLQKPKKRIISSNHIETSDNFFDENDWKRLKSCCGIVFENKQYGALIIDIQNYKPCSDHISFFKNPTNYTNKNNSYNMNNNNNGVISLNSSLMNPINNHIRKIHSIVIDNSEKLIKEEQTASLPAIKKHHLFLKRQMENYPRILSSLSDNLTVTTPTTNTTNILKTDLVSTSSTNINTAIITNNNNNSTMNIIKSSRENDSNEKSNKLTTIAPIVTTTTIAKPSSIDNGNNYKFKTLHQIRSDTGKIVKHSIDKINMLCVKQADLHEVKGLVKFTDKTLKPKFCAKLKITDATTATIQNKNVDPSNTKFSDNSSDSGFDENMLERKSISPPVS